VARGRRTDLKTAALVMELVDTGISHSQVSDKVGVPIGTVRDIAVGDFGWGKIAERSVFRRYRELQNQTLEADARDLAHEAFKQARIALPKASFYQAVIGGATLIDKARLLAGESTQNIEVHTKLEVEGLDKLSDLLSQRLLSNDVSNEDK
jgi:predicted transcriptional regulator